MTKFNLNKSYPLYEDDDSGMKFNYENSCSNDLCSSTRTFNESSSKIISFLLPEMIVKKRSKSKDLINFPSDGIIQRIRPATMKNSENSDFIICQTNRGTYTAHRTPIIPQWIRQLVHDIQLQEN